MSTAPQYRPHYTIEDYRLWEGDWELWNGTAVAMTPSPFGKHSRLHGRAVTELSIAVEQAGCDATVLIEIDWVVTSDTILRPDLTLVCGDAPDGHVETTPTLVAEVLSASTRERDLTFKRRLYAENSVPWYLILDPDADSMEALKLQPSGEYQAVSHDDVLIIDICESCSLNLSTARLFR